MWWKKLEEKAEELRMFGPYIHPEAKVSPLAIIDGPVHIEVGTIIDRFAIIQGPVFIGANCIVGDGTKIRGPSYIGSGARMGRQCELRNTIVGKKAAIGPLSFVCDSIVGEEAYLGAMVRTSNQNLDRSNARSMHEGKVIDTGLEKLGAYIGAKTSIGIQVIILPGRIVPAESLFGPRINIDKNYEPGRYILKQELEYTAPPGKG
jgi:NDP-sugar pyrophosphorylase family protein